MVLPPTTFVSVAPRPFTMPSSPLRRMSWPVVEVTRPTVTVDGVLMKIWPPALTLSAPAVSSTTALRFWIRRWLTTLNGFPASLADWNTTRLRPTSAAIGARLFASRLPVSRTRKALSALATT
ncbi:unannotated protein [freshwater metagenome]|uniref:Unannotated protein n=1 Tax=freshwater metagenome TaxID=449393 RepID=A0A6J7JT82_9ZZZZ